MIGLIKSFAVRRKGLTDSIEGAADWREGLTDAIECIVNLFGRICNPATANIRICNPYFRIANAYNHCRRICKSGGTSAMEEQPAGGSDTICGSRNGLHIFQKMIAKEPQNDCRNRRFDSSKA